MTTKMILVIELEMEKDVPNIALEVCQRITMHPHVMNAEPLSIAPSMEPGHAPKPQFVDPNRRHYMGMGVASAIVDNRNAPPIVNVVDTSMCQLGTDQEQLEAKIVRLADAWNNKLS